MLLACAILIAMPPQQAVSQRLTVDDSGAHVERLLRTSGGGMFRVDPGSGSIQVVTAPRWSESDGGLAWIGTRVAAGDDGASVIAGKSLNSEAVTLYPSGSSTPVFDVSTLGSEEPLVAVADRAGTAAAFVPVDTDPAPGTYDFVATVSVWSTAGTGTPAWTYTFPATGNYFGGGVAISDDGAVILAWKADPNTQTLLIEAFDAGGNSISSGALSVVSGPNTYFNSRQTRLSDDGSRAYFNISSRGLVYDVASGTLEYDHNVGSSFDSHALSGDGKRFAYGGFGNVQVWEESSPGVWTQAAFRSTGSGTYGAYVALNEDGSRLGYEVQQYSPAYDHIEVGLYDVDNDVDLFNQSIDAPGTPNQLSASGVELDDAGDSVAASSWGDSFNATYEGMVFDAAGNLTCTLDTPGSAMDLGFDADGDVIVLGTKAVHANDLGSGGSIFVADAQDQELHLSGYPASGGSLVLEAADSGDFVQVGVTSALGSSNSHFGVTELDLGTLVRILGPYAIPSGGLTRNLNVPANPGLVGRIFHLQGGIYGGAPGHLTNKISVRVLP